MESKFQKPIKIPADINLAWTRNFSFLGTYLQAQQHLKELDRYWDVKYGICAFYHHKGQVCFFRREYDEKNERKLYGDRCFGEKNYLKSIVEINKMYSNLVNNFLLKQKKLAKNNIEKFFQLLNIHFAFHHAVFFTADYLDKTDLVKEYPSLVKKLDQARKYNEFVLYNVEQWLGKNNSDCLLLTPDECLEYIKHGIKPSLTELKKRDNAAFAYFDQSQSILFTGKKAQYYYKKFNDTFLARFQRKDLIKGRSAFPGIYQGRVRVVDRFEDFKNLKKEEVLVAAMTLPEYNQYIKNVGAIVTDEGAVLCHAAIIAREFKIPCVIGTKISTKIFHDGDYVEVDARKLEGTVKILRKNI